MVELIPGTTLPVYAPGSSVQDEGRDFVQVNRDRAPVSLFERLAQRDDVSAAELVFLDAAVRAFDRRPKHEEIIYASTGRTTDATTGNLVMPLFLVPAGAEAHVSQVLVDVPGSATINPSAPFANAASWMFLAAAGASTGAGAGSADSLRQGMVAFAPTSAAGPMIPGQWTFNDSNAPVLQGGDQLYLIVHGGSVAALLAQSVQATYRINLYTNMV